MNAEISDQNSIRILQQAFSALKKISNDVIIVVGEDFFSIRALNSTKSALPVVTFKSSFFRSFQFDSSVNHDGQIVAQIQANCVTTAIKNAQNPNLLILSLKVATNSATTNNQLSDDDIDFNEKGSTKKNSSIYDKTFIMSLVDKYSIMHKWEFPLSDAQVLNAMFDLNDTIAEVKCRFDILEGLSDAFKSINTIFLEINNNTGNINNSNNSVNNPKRGALLFKSSPVIVSSDTSNNTDVSLTSTLSIFKSERCEVINYQNDKGSNVAQVAFSLFEFLVGLKIAKYLNQYVTLHIIGPGQPLIMIASMPSVEFKMPLATINDENENEDEDENENEFQNESENENDFQNQPIKKPKELTKVKQEKNQELFDFNDNHQPLDSNSNSNTDESQVTPWNFMNSNKTDLAKVKSEKPEPKVSFDSQDLSSLSYDKKSSRISQKFAQYLYEESPPFPSKRKFAGSNEVAQASQPMSDEEDEEY